MKRLIAAISVLLSLSAVMRAGTKIVFVPQWHPQSQFAGYYVALEKGFYAEEGLDVEIRHLSQTSTKNALDVLEAGECDIIGQQLLQSVISRSDGSPIVNVMQLTQVSGLWCVGKKPLRSLADLNGLKIAKWKVGFSEFCDMVEKIKGINLKWVPFINDGTTLFVYGAVDATLCYSYSEYISLILATGMIPEENVLKFSDYGYDCPEDGLYVTEKFYGKNRDIVDKFVRASKKGWDYVRSHRDEALKITDRYVREANIVTSALKQKMMLDKYLNLQVNPDTGEPDYAPVRREVLEDIQNALIQIGYISGKVEYEDFVK